MYTAYYKRFKDSIEGVFTIQRYQNGVITKIFDKIPTRSGQIGYENTNWVKNKSPIPLTEKTESPNYLYLWLSPIKPIRDSMVSFFQISSRESNRSIIWNKYHTHSRGAIGDHFDDNFPSTNGCTAQVHKEDFLKIHEFFQLLGKEQEYIRYVTFL